MQTVYIYISVCMFVLYVYVRVCAGLCACVCAGLCVICVIFVFKHRFLVICPIRRV